MVLCVSIFGCYIFRNSRNMQNRIFCDISRRLLKPAQSVLRGGPGACGGHARHFGARWCRGASWGRAGRQSGSCDPRAPQPQPAGTHTPAICIAARIPTSASPACHFPCRTPQPEAEVLLPRPADTSAEIAYMLTTCIHTCMYTHIHMPLSIDSSLSHALHPTYP